MLSDDSLSAGDTNHCSCVCHYGCALQDKLYLEAAALLLPGTAIEPGAKQAVEFFDAAERIFLRRVG